ncbi:MAG TPA: mannose-1-phosphate guanyltransferase [Bacteroidales bacterium]|nr:mannose-1-phosphate guanyltransferase [Bacteroidales bacterium]
MQAMIFAAGLGTRLRPLTSNKPKALVEIGGMTLLQRLIEKLKRQGFNNIVVNIHHFGEQIIEFLHHNDNFGVAVQVSDERGQLLDTGGGLLYAERLFNADEPVLIHNVDIVSNLDFGLLYRTHLQSDAMATLVVSKRETSRYLLFDDCDSLCGWENIKTGETLPQGITDKHHYERLAFAGIHVVSPSVFELMHSRGLTGAFPIVPFYVAAAAENSIKAYKPADFRMMDVGKISQMPEAEIFVRSI